MGSRIVRTRQELDDVVRLLSKMDPSAGYEIIVRRAYRRRSPKQSSWEWKCHRIVTAVIYERTGKRFTPEDVREYVFRGQCCPYIAVNGVAMPKRPSEMTTVEHSNAMRRYREWGRDTLGIELPDPDENQEDTDDAA